MRAASLKSSKVPPGSENAHARYWTVHPCLRTTVLRFASVLVLVVRLLHRFHLLDPSLSRALTRFLTRHLPHSYVSL